MNTWCILINECKADSYQYIYSSKGYIFHGTKEAAKIKFTEKFCESEECNTIKEYWENLGEIDEDTSEQQIKKLINSVYSFVNCDEAITGYALLSTYLLHYSHFKNTGFDLIT